MSADEVVDPDVDLHDPAQRRELADRPVVVLAAISAGGVLGALGRYGVSELLPHEPGMWAWGTLLVNASGCLLIGVLMVFVTERSSASSLVRPFLGVGVLGGYTTFSTTMVEVQQLVAAGAARTGLAYLALTVVTALAAVTVGWGVARGLLRATRRRQGAPW